MSCSHSVTHETNLLQNEHLAVNFGKTMGKPIQNPSPGNNTITMYSSFLKRIMLYIFFFFKLLFHNTSKKTSQYVVRSHDTNVIRTFNLIFSRNRVIVHSVECLDVDL